MKTDIGLFRAEALEPRSNQHLGSIRIGSNPGHLAVATVALLLAGSLVAFALLGEVTRKSRIPGVLTPQQGMLQLVAPGVGSVGRIAVAESEFVAAGQLLIELHVDRSGHGGETAGLVALSLQDRRRTIDTESALREVQARLRSESLRDRLRALSLEVEQGAEELALADRRTALAAENLERYQRLVVEGFMSHVQVQARQDEFLDLKGRAQLLARTLSALRREQLTLVADLQGTQGELRAAQAQLERSRAALQQEVVENEARRRILVLAPHSGRISALHTSLGGAVQPGQVLATFIPEEDPQRPVALRADLYAPSRTAGFVAVGQEVWLRYHAFPYQKFGLARGVVNAVSRSPVNPQELPAGQAQALLQAAQSSEPLYRVSLGLDRQSVDAFGSERPLLPGMALEGEVMHERRAIWEWLLEPLLALRRAAVPQG